MRGKTPLSRCKAPRVVRLMRFPSAFPGLAQKQFLPKQNSVNFGKILWGFQFLRGTNLSDYEIICVVILAPF